MKVKCGICARENNGFCSVKGKNKKKVSLNKRRMCDYFILAESKVREKSIIPITRGFSPELRSDLKKEYKKHLKAEQANKYMKNNEDNKHPLTGDLSRFTSTAKAKIRKKI